MEARPGRAYIYLVQESKMILRISKTTKDHACMLRYISAKTSKARNMIHGVNERPD